MDNPYSEDLIPIDRIEFDVWSNSEVKDYSVIKSTSEPYGIILAETYDNNEPKRGGIVDQRLGTTDNQRTCLTCGEREKNCPGHFGHTEFAEPVFNFAFKDGVKSILSCICLRCSNLRISRSHATLEYILKYKNGKNRFIEIRKLAKLNNCQVCNAPIPMIKLEIKNTTGVIQFVAESAPLEGGEADAEKKKVREVLTPRMVYDILVNISDADWKLMGFDQRNQRRFRPEDLIIKNFPIPPVAIRPSVKADFLANGSSEDTLNNKLADIIKASQRLRKFVEKENPTEEERKYQIDFLKCQQYNVAVYYDNDTNLPKSAQKSCGRPVKSISERIVGKTGLIRNNLMGKRVNYCARSVITSDPNLSLDELGVPIKIAMNLTFTEVVTPHNYNRLMELVRNGRYKYPGANMVRVKRGDKYIDIDLRYNKSTVNLNMGDEVWRHLQPGDPVLFNRQPTLHKMSMMTHRVKVINNDKLSTFRLNVTVTSPYGADFDGDEMNMFVPQSIQTQTELAMISDVKRQIMSPMHAKPVIKLKQDTLIGSHQLTEKSLIIDWHDAMNMIMYTYETDVLKIKKKDIDSLEMYSMIIPDGINYKDAKSHIQNGKLLKGIAGKKLSEQIMITSWDKYDPQTTKVYIDNTQRITAYWLINYGFTVGLRDACPSKEIKALAKKIITEKEMEVEHLITEIENNPEMLDADLFEEDVKAKLNRRVDIGTKIMELLDSKNHFYTMVNSGAKGDAETNIGPIMGALAQDLLKQKRIPKQVNGRTLPHFFQNDDRPASRGYIKSSYYEGLEPHEFWFHHMTGREGLISTAIKTAETGYQQRKLIKGLEDIKVMYDGTVRTGNNVILQLIYGANNFELTKQKYVKVNTLPMGDAKIHEIYEDMAQEMIEMRDKLRDSQMRFLIEYKTNMETYLQTVNFARIIYDNKIIDSNSNEQLTNDYVKMKLQEVLTHEMTPLLTMVSPEKNPLKHADEQRFKFLFKLCLYEYLAPSRCIKEYKFNKVQFDNTINEVVKSYNRSMINYGEMVGVVTAQSVGEPLTQQTLSSFHKTGAGGLQGAERFRELLGYTKNIKTPYMSIYLKEEYSNNKIMAYKIASYLKYTVLKDVAQKIMIVYDSDIENKRSYTVKDEMDTKSIFGINADKIKSLETMPWLFRVSLNKEAMLHNDVTMLDIKTQFVQFWTNTYGDMTGVKKNMKDFIAKITRGCILSNYNNSDNPIVHIRFELTQTDNSMLIELYEIILNKFKLKGSESIKRVDEISEESIITYNNPDREAKTEKECVIYANGIDMNLIKHIPMIDMNRSYCNSLQIILKNYGIEAARAYLIHEMPLQFTDPKPIAQHQMLIADLMTSTGTITSIDRHGMNRMDKDPLAKASFEKMMEHFVNAAMFSEIDTLQSVSSQVMLGKQIRGGTGMCDILMDNELLENTATVEIGGTRPDPNAIQLSTGTLIDDILKMDDIRTYIPT